MTSPLQGLNSAIELQNVTEKAKEGVIWPPVSNANWRDTLKGMSTEDYLLDYVEAKMNPALFDRRELPGPFKVAIESARRSGKSLFPHIAAEWAKKDHSVRHSLPEKR